MPLMVSDLCENSQFILICPFDLCGFWLWNMFETWTYNTLNKWWLLLSKWLLEVLQLLYDVIAICREPASPQFSWPVPHDVQRLLQLQTSCLCYRQWEGRRVGERGRGNSSCICLTYQNHKSPPQSHQKTSAFSPLARTMPHS